ncbi:hypothetical protein ABZ860_12355 [Microbispora sp. NPDC046973]|uniref:hypothetical protein n=1 Tax=Microbispora sp. NPDC046973 TaxID=3155022 RepID=UPI0033FB1F15
MGEVLGEHARRGAPDLGVRTGRQGVRERGDDAPEPDHVRRDEHGQEYSEVVTVRVAAGRVDQQRVDRDASRAVVLAAETMGESGGGRISPYITPSSAGSATGSST